MPVANPTFAYPGTTPGSAAQWTLTSVCQRARLAAFGPAPELAFEDFERWFAWLSELTSVVRAFFDVSARGFESFEAWLPGVFLFAHDDALLEAAAFAGSPTEDFGSPWVPALALAWSDVSSTPAVFGSNSSEDFEAWSTTPTPTFTGAKFGFASAESFETTWPTLPA